MKTLQELFDEVIASNELKRAFVEALKSSGVEEFMRQNGCDATVEELAEFLEQKAASEDAPMELSEDVLEAVAGGSILSQGCGDHGGGPTEFPNCC